MYSGAKINPVVWLFVALLFVSGFLMIKDKWWGCMFGIVTGVILIYMGMQETGQIIKEWPIGIIFCLYYIICGFIAAKNRKVN